MRTLAIACYAKCTVLRHIPVLYIDPLCNMRPEPRAALLFTCGEARMIKCWLCDALTTTRGGMRWHLRISHGGT